MDSLAKITIFDCIERWSPSRCSTCGSFVDAVWIHEDVALPRLSLWQLCTNCKRGFLPAREAAAWEDQYTRIRRARIRLGLGHRTPTAAVMRALSLVPGEALTLFNYSMHSESAYGHPLPRSEFPRIEAYAILGQRKDPCVVANKSPEWADYPQFIGFPADNPDHFHVVLGLDISDPLQPGVSIELTWQPNSPSSRYIETINTRDGIPPEARRQAVDRCLRALDERFPQQNQKLYTRESYEDMLRAQYAETGQIPKMEQFLERNQLVLRTFKRHKVEYGMGDFRKWAREVIGRE